MNRPCLLALLLVLVSAYGVGHAVTRNFGVKVGYLGKRALADTGVDFDSFIIGATFFWSE